MRLCFAALTAMVLIANSANAAEFVGMPRVVDGDTLTIGAAKIRLQGIDAPETDQVCLNASGQQWTCGLEARDRLAAHIAGREIRCVSTDIDVYGRELALCSVAGEDLNGWMVREGWALAYVKYSSAYVSVEEQARTRQSGLWQGAFIAPWDWRRRNNMTTMMGTLKEAQATLLGPSAAANAPSPDCTIKGTITRAGRMIYHTPYQKSYAKIRMDKGIRRWFCTSEEAEAVGARKALR